MIIAKFYPHITGGEKSRTQFDFYLSSDPLNTCKHLLRFLVGGLSEQRSSQWYISSLVSHIFKSIPQTTTFLGLGLGLWGIRVILRGMFGFSSVFF